MVSIITMSHNYSQYIVVPMLRAALVIPRQAFSFAPDKFLINWYGITGQQLPSVFTKHLHSSPTVCTHGSESNHTEIRCVCSNNGTLHCFQ